LDFWQPQMDELTSGQATINKIYIDEKNIEMVKKTVNSTPFFVIPDDKISLF
jgi:hypothetical protein